MDEYELMKARELEESRIDKPKATDEEVCEVARRYLLSGWTMMDPTVIEFLDTHEVAVVPQPYLTDMSWSDHSRPYYVHATIADLIENALDPVGPGCVLSCLRCGHIWLQRFARLPKHCPKCNSPYWNRLRSKP